MTDTRTTLWRLEITEGNVVIATNGDWFAFTSAVEGHMDQAAMRTGFDPVRSCFWIEIDGDIPEWLTSAKDALAKSLGVPLLFVKNDFACE